jgi:PDZ domain-containing protein
MRRRLPYLAVPIAALLIVLSEVTLPYWSEGPGPAREVEPLIDVSGHQVYQSQGKFILTSVSGHPLNAFQAIGAWLDPKRAVVPEDLFVLPGESEQQAIERASSEMDQSKLVAAAFVLAKVAGYPKNHGPGVLVDALGTDCPATGRLFVGDLLQSVDGKPVGSERDFERLVNSVPAEQPIRLAGRAGGERFSVRLIRRPCSGYRMPIIGIDTIPNFPFRVRISSGDIGGPSAGLMWALGLYDLLTPGDLPADRTIAGTGTLNFVGTVGPIGGVTDKIVAAEQEGAKVFLVPRRNLAEARKAASGITLVPVGTFQDALRYLHGAADGAGNPGA